MAGERTQAAIDGARSLATTGVGPGTDFTISYRPPPNSGVDGWFGPLNPMQPMAPDNVKGRILDYPTGYNLNVRPRSYEAISFQMLRNFADSYDLLRILIETRKDQMSRLEWNVVPRDKKLRQKNAVATPEMDARIAAVVGFFLRPDKENFWGDWLRMLLEDLLVIDAPSIYRRTTYGGALYALQPLDGGTIKRVIDNFGNTPGPGEVAYQQVLKGYPAVDYTTEELLYRPRVKRTHKIYGYSPVEQIVMTINIGMRRQMWQLQSFTEGNVPEALIGTPDNWTPEQVAQFQTWFDSLLQGNSGERRRARFVPGGVAKGYVPTKTDEIFGKGEEWLIRVMCFAFNVSPQPFVQMMNRATAETAQEAAIQDGLAPLQNWVKGLMDTILIDDFNSPDLEFVWNEEDELDPDKKSQIVDREQAAGRLTFNEARREQGLDPFDHPDADRPMFKSAAGYTPIFLTPEEQAEKDAAKIAMQAALGQGGEDAPGEGSDEDPDGGDGPPPPPGAGKPPVTPPGGEEGAAKAAMPSGLAKEQEREENGQFAGGGGGDAGGSEEDDSSSGGTFTEDTWQDAPASGFGGGKGTAAEQSKREVARVYRNAKDAPEGRAERLKSVAETHRGNSERMAEVAQGWADQGNYQTAGEVMASSRFQAEHADALEAKAGEVAEKSDVPFLRKQGCGCNLAKAGRVSNSNPADPLRPKIAKIESKLAKALAGTLARLGATVAKQVQSALEAVAKADIPDDFDIDAMLAALDLSVLEIDYEDLEDALDRVGRDAAKVTLSVMGMSTNTEITDQVNDRALIWASSRAAELVSFDDDADPMLASATRDMLRATIASGIDQNIGMPQIAEEIRSNYAFSEDRAYAIAATEVTTANSMGALASFEEAKAAGVKVRKSWLILEDACDVCQENADAGPIDLDEDFPSGDPAPGAHPHCRCVLVPEVEDGDDTDVEFDDTLELAAMPDGLKKEQEREANGQFGSGSGGGDVPQVDLEASSPEIEDRGGVNEKYAGAINQYTDMHHRYVNNTLRAGGEFGKNDAKQVQMVKDLDKAMSKSGFKEDGVVFRGLEGAGIDAAEKALGADGKDKWMIDGGFQSTTTDPAVAASFSVNKGAILQIDVPRGTPALDLANGTRGGVIGEKEVILGRSLPMQITGKSSWTDGTGQEHTVYHARMARVWYTKPEVTIKGSPSNG